MKCKRCENEVKPGEIAMTNKDHTEWQCNMCLGWNKFEPEHCPERIDIPPMSFKKDVLKLHILYLEKVDSLNKGERMAYEGYLTSLNRAPYINILKVEEG